MILLIYTLTSHVNALFLGSGRRGSTDYSSLLFKNVEELAVQHQVSLIISKPHRSFLHMQMDYFVVSLKKTLYK